MVLLWLFHWCHNLVFSCLEGCLTVSSLQCELVSHLTQVAIRSSFFMTCVIYFCVACLSVEIAGDYPFDCLFCRWIQCQGVCDYICGRLWRGVFWFGLQRCCHVISMLFDTLADCDVLQHSETSDVSNKLCALGSAAIACVCTAMTRRNVWFSFGVHFGESSYGWLSISSVPFPSDM